jgi:hypothetical protein
MRNFASRFHDFMPPCDFSRAFPSAPQHWVFAAEPGGCNSDKLPSATRLRADLNGHVQKTLDRQCRQKREGHPPSLPTACSQLSGLFRRQLARFLKLGNAPEGPNSCKLPNF